MLPAGAPFLVLANRAMSPRAIRFRSRSDRQGWLPARQTPPRRAGQPRAAALEATLETRLQSRGRPASRRPRRQALCPQPLCSLTHLKPEAGSHRWRHRKNDDGVDIPARLLPRSLRTGRRRLVVPRQRRLEGVDGCPSVSSRRLDRARAPLPLLSRLAPTGAGSRRGWIALACF